VPLVALGGAQAPNGDADILLWDPARADKAVAIETKRLRVRAKDYATHVVSGLCNVPKGGLQASKLPTLGIHRSYLLLMLAADASEEPDMDFWQQDLTPIQREQVIGALEQLRLDERVGVMLTIVMQHRSDELVPVRETRRLVMGREAVPQVQPADLTVRVREYFANNPTDT
jgi:hypothetical protein